MRRPVLPHSPSRQILLIGVVFAAAGTLVLGLGLGQLQRVRGDLDGLDSRVLPATVELASADRDLADSTSRFSALLGTPGGGANSPDLSLINDLHNRATRHWGAFKPLAGALANTSRLVSGIDADIARIADLAVPLLQTPDAAAIAEFNALASTLHRDLGILNVRFTRALRSSSYAAREHADATLLTALAAYAVTLFAIVAVTLVAAKRSRRSERETARSEADRTHHSERDQLAARVQRGMEMVRDEDESFHVIDTALRVSFGVTPVELLIADSSTGHLRRVAGTTDEPAVGSTCAVTSPDDCPATKQNQTMEFARSDDIDACPFLRRRSGDTCSATCTPVAVMGKAIGVFCAIEAEGVPLDSDGAARMELIARKAGERLTLLRSFARSHTQATTDPLTSLANRRSLEEAARSLTNAGRPYVVAYADLDHFKLLNDVHGHDAGDKALQVFARILRDSVRPGDFPARYGGEEFVVILPDCSVNDATSVLDRVRSALREALVATDLPEFTVSFGLSATDSMRAFADVVTEADEALHVAKAAGRDRVVGPSDGREDEHWPPAGLVTAN